MAELREQVLLPDQGRVIKLLMSVRDIADRQLQVMYQRRSDVEQPSAMPRLPSMTHEALHEPAPLVSVVVPTARCRHWTHEKYAAPLRSDCTPDIESDRPFAQLARRLRRPNIPEQGASRARHERPRLAVSEDARFC